MTMLPLVHIGMAKAASTFLQLEVFPNVKGLLNLGKHHVSNDLRNAGNALTRRTSADWNLTMFREPFDAALAKASAEGLRPVLSNEDFSVYKFLDPEMMALRLRQILGPYDVLLIIREPVSWLRSHYLFRLEHQNPIAALGFDHWLQTHLESRRIGSDVMEIWYDAVVRVYKETCGGDIHILPYELMKSDVARFADELSLILETPMRPLLDLLETPKDARAHKLRITEAKQKFYELFRYVVLEQPDRAESEVRAMLANCGTQQLPADLDTSLRDVTVAPRIDRKEWAKVFRAAAKLMPRDGTTAAPSMPQDMEKRIKHIGIMQIKRLKANQGFDLDHYGITY